MCACVIFINALTHITQITHHTTEKQQCRLRPFYSPFTNQSLSTSYPKNNCCGIPHKITSLNHTTRFKPIIMMQQESSIAPSTPQQTLATSSYHLPSKQFSCQDSYRMFKQCSTLSGSTEGFNCSDAVKSYMKCALGERQCHL